MSQDTGKQIAPIDEVRRSLTQMKDQFKMALPPQVDVDRFIRVSMTAVQNSPALLKTDRHSLYSACMKAAQSGLLPDGQESAIVKFGDSAAFMPMIKGILKQIRNSGELKSIMAQVVYKNDKFRYWVDAEGEHIEHEPNWFSDRGDRIGVYAIGTTKDGGVYIEVLSKDQVGAIRKVSRAKDGPWDGPFEDEMWRKSALRRLAKRMPMSTDLEGLMKSDDDLFMPPPPAEEAAVGKPEEGGSKRASKTAKLVQKATQKTDEIADEPAPTIINHAPQTTAMPKDQAPL